MIIYKFKYLAMSGLVVIFLASINVVQAEGVSTTQDVIPPAPLGPYVSTGLLESEDDAHDDVRDIEAQSVDVVVPVQNPTAVSPVSNDDKKAFVTKPAVQVESNKIPMEAFSPDIPWPADMRPPVSQSSARRMSNHMMPDYNRRQISPETSRQQNSLQQYRPAYYRAPVPNNSAYSRRLTVPQTANQPMSKLPNTDFSGFNYQMPNSYLPRNNFSSGYPAGSMPNPNYYQPGYTN